MNVKIYKDVVEDNRCVTEKEKQEETAEHLRRKAEVASTIKVLKCIFFFAAVFFLTLQLSSLANEYFAMQTSVSYSVVNEEIYLPALSICIKTTNHLKKKALKRYNLDASALEFEDNVAKDKWEGFPWSESNISQLYVDAIIYPHQYVTKCQALGKPCLDASGKNYFWMNQITRTITCSTLVLNEKVEPGTHSIRVDMSDDVKSEKNPPQFILHDADNQLLSYSTEDMMVFDYYKHYSGYRYESLEHYGIVKKHVQLKRNDKNSCKEQIGYNKHQCLKNCIENNIAEGGCVLPWMTLSGKPCRNPEELEHAIKRELEEISKGSCSCPEPCTTWVYEWDALTSITQDGRISFVAAVHNEDGIETIEETHMFTPLTFIAAVGGTIGVYFDLATPLIAGYIIYCLLYYFLRVLSKIYLVATTKTLTRKWRFSFDITMQVTLFVLFCYQGYQITDEYLQFPKVISIQPTAKHRALPPILFCAQTKNKSFQWDHVEQYGSDYMRDYLFIRVKPSLLNCTLMGEDCMADNGMYHNWITNFDIFEVCDVLQITPLIGDQRFQGKELLSLTIHSDCKFICTVGNAFLQKSAYSLVHVLTMHGMMHYESHFTFTIEEKWNLPPCDDNHFEFAIDSIMKEYTALYNESCIIPGNGLNLREGLKLCTSNAETKLFMNRFSEIFINHSRVYTLDSSCSAVRYKLHTRAQKYIWTDSLTKMNIILKPEVESSKEEIWKMSSSQLIGRVAGLFGLLTGWTLMFIMEIAIGHMGAIVGHIWKPTTKFLAVASSLVKMLLWAFFLSEVYKSLSSYMEYATITQVSRTDGSDMVIPLFTLCHDNNPIWKVGRGDNLIVYNHEHNVKLYTPIRPSSASDVEAYVPSTPFNPYTLLKKCSIFGHSCLEKSGEIYEWVYASSFNRHCSSLRTNVTSLSGIFKDLSLKLRIDANGNEMLLYITDKYHLPSIYNDVRLSELYMDNKFFESFKISYNSLKKMKVGEFKDCNENPNYTMKQCLKDCIDAHVLSKLNCTFPWKKKVPGFDLCYRREEYLYLDQINYTFVNQCPCEKSCYINWFNVEKVRAVDEDYDLYIMLNKVVWEYEEIWSYSFLRLLADLGGAMATFTGLTFRQIINTFFSIEVFSHV